MQVLRWIFPALTAVAAVLVLQGSALAAPSYTFQVTGFEYSATATTGMFSGIAAGPLAGTWDATVVHDQLKPGTPIPITGGSVTLYTGGPITGNFTNGTVSPINTPMTCVDERFNVTGTLAFDGGGTGEFTVVLTHLRAKLQSDCVTFGAIVVGTLTLSAHLAGA